MTSLVHPLSLVVAVVASLSFLSGCATRAINPPLLRYD